MTTKLDQLKSHMRAGDRRAALRLAASWPRLGRHKAAIQRGWAALAHPDLYRQMGEDPEALVAEGVRAIEERYDIEFHQSVVNP